MNGIDQKKLHEMIVGSPGAPGAYRRDEFRRLLAYELDIDFDAEVGNVGFSEGAELVLNRLAGRWLLPQLLAGMAADRPHRVDIQDCFQKTAAQLVSESRKSQIDARVAKAYARYGLAPPLSMQAGGEDVETPAGQLEKIVEPLKHFVNPDQWVTLLVQMQYRVGRVEIDTVPVGTGFLVGPDTLLTNFHVLQKVISPVVKKPSNVVVRFDYKNLPNLHVSPGLPVPLADDWLIDHSPFTPDEAAGQPDKSEPTDEQLDYALVRLKAAVGAERVDPNDPASRTRGWIQVPDAAPPIHPGMTLVILQHPRTAPLKLGIDTRAVIKTNNNGTRVRYATNTEPGSSGSPCFDMDWGLVALHHYGDPGFAHPKWNQGIPIFKIRELLTKRNVAKNLGTPPAVPPN
jgi:hypothetical protein